MQHVQYGDDGPLNAGLRRRRGCQRQPSCRSPFDYTSKRIGLMPICSLDVAISLYADSDVVSANLASSSRPSSPYTSPTPPAYRRLVDVEHERARRPRRDSSSQRVASRRQQPPPKQLLHPVVRRRELDHAPDDVDLARVQRRHAAGARCRSGCYGSAYVLLVASKPRVN